MLLIYVNMKLRQNAEMWKIGMINEICSKAQTLYICGTEKFVKPKKPRFK